MSKIDWERVDQLRDEVGPEDFHEVVELFLEEVEEVIARLKTAPEPSNYEEELHFLKGSALNLGFRNFGDLCHAGERAASLGRADSVNLLQVFDAYAASKSEFLTRLNIDDAAA